MDPICLEYKGKTGDVKRYATTIDTKQILIEKGARREGTQKVQVIMTQTITDVSSDGIFTVQVVIDSGKVMSEGKSLPLPNAGQKIMMKMKKSGVIISCDPPTDFSQPSFPEGPKNVKERWTSESKVNVQGRPDPITLSYRYILWDLIKVNAYNCAEIKVSCPETATEIQPGVTQKISATGTTLFEYNQGFLVKSEVETKTIVEAPEHDVHVETRIGVRVEVV